MNRLFATAAAVTVLAASSAATAVEIISDRRVVAVGCHHGDGTCYVTLDGAPFGAQEGCAQGTSFTQFRWDNADTPNGKRTYASFLAAYLQQKKVYVAIAGCSRQGIPSLSYYTVSD